MSTSLRTGATKEKPSDMSPLEEPMSDLKHASISNRHSTWGDYVKMQSNSAQANWSSIEQKGVPSAEKVYKLADFVKKFGQKFPLRIKVIEGFCGIEERSVISTGDLYNFHALKHETMITIEDDRGAQFSIPVTSPGIKFGLIFDPVSDTETAMKGYRFRKIGDAVTTYSTYPLVIRATKSSGKAASNSKSTVVAEEILVIKDVQHNAHGQDVVKVFSLLSRGEKTLSKECEGHFLTDPAGIQLHPTDIIDCFRNRFPLNAKLFLNSDLLQECDENIAQLDTEIVAIVDTSVQSSIVATTCWDTQEEIPNLEDHSETKDSPLCIPTNLKIAVAAVNSHK